MLRLPRSVHRPLPKQTIVVQSRHHTRIHSSNESEPFALETQAKSSSSTPIALSPAALNSYTITHPPNQAQLKYSASFFHASPPEFLFSAAHFRAFPPSSFPEVAFLGRSNVGKSSLLNALFGRTKVKDAHVSKRPGRTQTMNGFGITGGLTMGKAPRSGEKEEGWKRFPRGGLIVVDMPGYGGGSRADWGKEALKYLEHREQLRRTFVLVDAQHGLKASDVSLLTHLRRLGISHQIVLSKFDKLLFSGSKPPGPQKMQSALLQIQELCASVRQRLDDEAGDGRQSTGDILCCSAEKSISEKQHNRRIGVDEVRWAVLSACGLDSDEFGQTKRRHVEDVRILDEGE